MLLDYEYSLRGLPEGSIEREIVKHEVHQRSAQKLQELCFKNGGIYIKLGQHLGQLVCFIFLYLSFLKRNKDMLITGFINCNCACDARKAILSFICLFINRST